MLIIIIFIVVFNCICQLFLKLDLVLLENDFNILNRNIYLVCIIRYVYVDIKLKVICKNYLVIGYLEEKKFGNIRNCEQKYFGIYEY